MNEMKKTIVFLLTATVLAVAAIVVDPGRATPEIFSDQGEPFYPDFSDAQAPRAIEVVDYDDATATARPLKVEFADNHWRIPSHHNYPADAEDRLSKTAAALMELRKDAIISERIEDHAEYGVIDPLDQEVTSLAGRGKRVTLRDENDEVLADFIVGKKVEGKQNRRYMRVATQKRIYDVETTADVSAKFEDWIETDLLKLAAGDIRKISINSYSINERLGILQNQERVVLTHKDNKWRMSGSGTPQDSTVNALTGALDSLKIVDVQPKPANLTRDLKTKGSVPLTQEAAVSLRQKGFFLTRGGLYSNEGEIVVETKNGLQYALRFGEIASSGAAGSAEAGASQDEQDSKNERRYVFITVDYSAARAKQYNDGDDPVDEGKELGAELRHRFADWYYVISGADFNKLRPSRKDLRG